jgi:hypothetical protein
MYRGFELEINDWNIDSYYAQGLKVFDFYKDKVTPVLDDYLKDNKALDGDAMRKDWFPEVKADIFISHSHTDKNLAICLAGWLYKEFEIKAFIDSMIWGYADDLLLAIDNKYCKTADGSQYIYKKRNYSTSHIHIMLTAALNKMIDKSECFFFIKTSNSITTEKAIKQASTYSPWIYSEIETSRIIRKKPWKDYRNFTTSEIRMFSAEDQKNLNENLKIEHPLDTEHLEVVTKDELMLWKQQFKIKQEKYPLDILYKNHSINKIL